MSLIGRGIRLSLAGICVFAGPFCVQSAKIKNRTGSGEWANKHGAGAPAPLGEGVTPASQNTTGWDLGDLEYFYDSDWFVYIITRN